MQVITFIKKVLIAIVPYGFLVLYWQRKNKYKEIKVDAKKEIKLEPFFFEVQLADHCNLNCIGCSHFSPVADECFLNVDDYEKDCKTFAQLAGEYVNEIHLMGGEPLLNKKIDQIIYITRNNFSKSVIKIVTNGILLDRMNTGFWDACKNNNIIISITHYPININVKKIYELYIEYGVKIQCYSIDFCKKFRKDVYDVTGSQNIIEQFSKCKKKICHHLYEGKFYMCPSPPYIKYINKYFGNDFKILANDYIDINQVKDISVLIKYLKEPIPFCRYCNIDKSDYNITWSTSKKKITEWT